MENLPPKPERPAPTNYITLNGQRFVVMMDGITVSEQREELFGYENTRTVTVDYSRLSGSGVVHDLEQGSITKFVIGPLQTHAQRKDYESHKPQHLSDIFIGGEAVNRPGYADAVAEHLLGLIQAATESVDPPNYLLDPVRINQRTNEIIINLETYPNNCKPTW